MSSEQKPGHPTRLLGEQGAAPALPLAATPKLDRHTRHPSAGKEYPFRAVRLVWAASG